MLAIRIILSVIGGLGIFLLGMKNMSEGMQAVAGTRMRKLINAITNNRLIACGVGIAITSLIQSSSVTTVMVVGMVNAGIMNLLQAIGVILGADIGTTITGWILVLQIAKYGLPMMGFSALFYLFSKNERIRYTAMMLLGLGMVFFGLQLMKEGFYPLRNMPEFLAWFSKFQPDTYFGVLRCCLAGTIITAVVQSSSATLGITMGLVGTGVISFETGVALVLGENIGTTITACLASLGASTNAKRAALAHVIIKVIGVAWITAIFPFYINLVKSIIGADMIPTAQLVNGNSTFIYAMRGIAISHTGFNVANVLIFLPFTNILARFLPSILPDKGYKEIPKLKFLDVRMLDAPAVGIQQSKKEIMIMSEGIIKMLDYLRTIMEKNIPDEKTEGKIFHREEVLDVIQKEIVEFLSNLLSGNVPHDVMNNGRIQLRMADEYESISDYIANILKLNLKIRKINQQMSEFSKNEILELHDRVSTYIRFINESVKEENKEILSKANTKGDAITHFIKECRTKHLQRVGTEYTSPLKSLIFTDMLNSYRRIKDHALNIAETLAGEK
ncbi:MAG: Na/Pi cotransporter family protein [Planctomycetota bacterium]|jgi:phosphate:Na+ symporter